MGRRHAILYKPIISLSRRDPSSVCFAKQLHKPVFRTFHANWSRKSTFACLLIHLFVLISLYNLTTPKPHPLAPCLQPHRIIIYQHLSLTTLINKAKVSVSPTDDIKAEMIHEDNTIALMWKSTQSSVNTLLECFNTQLLVIWWM